MKKTSLSKYFAAALILSAGLISFAETAKGVTVPLYVGSNSSSQTTNFTSGTHIYSVTYVGYTATDSNNLLEIDNTNTLLTNSSFLYVGYGGSSNSMVISNGGQVRNTLGYVGYSGTSSNNSVLVTGTNSLWSNSGSLYFGYNGSSNSMVISNGGQLRNAAAFVGNGNASSNNSVVVIGTNSLWSNSINIQIGYGGSGNSLVISNGGQVRNAIGIVGNASTSSNNSVLVTGTNSFWSNSSAFYVGNSGSGNSLVISNGGQVRNAAGNVGSVSGSSNNSVLVTGSNSLWSNSGDLTIGNYGTGTLTISASGTVADNNGWIGYSNTSSNNSVLVTGSNSLWSNTFQLTIGKYGSGNSLVISNGGKVVSAPQVVNAPGTYGVIGAEANSSNNSVLVTGTGSLWSMSDTLEVGAGANSSGNSLTIANGGKVQAEGQYFLGVALYLGGYGINDGGAANSNTVTVTGAGSLLALNGDALVSTDENSGNQLSVLNGASMTASNLFISYALGSPLPNSSNNSVLISGSSTVTLAGDTYVGWDGHNDTLTISNGGILSDSNGWIGFTNTATNHSVLVTGTSSAWSNSGTLTIGVGGSGTLTVANGGSVAASGISIAASNTSGGTLNFGSYGGNDTAGTVTAPTIAFGSGTGSINFNQTNTATLTSSISGLGSVNQLGTGTTILTGSNSYTGATTINAGTLLANNTAGSAR